MENKSINIFHHQEYIITGTRLSYNNLCTRKIIYQDIVISMR